MSDFPENEILILDDYDVSDDFIAGMNLGLKSAMFLSNEKGTI